MYKIEYLPIAQADINEAVDYLVNALSAPQVAYNLLDELDSAVKQIAEFPYSSELYWSKNPLPCEIRKIPIKSFVLYYAVFKDRVEIRRFLHGRHRRDEKDIYE